MFHIKTFKFKSTNEITGYTRNARTKTILMFSTQVHQDLTSHLYTHFPNT